MSGYYLYAFGHMCCVHAHMRIPREWQVYVFKTIKEAFIPEQAEN